MSKSKVLSYAHCSTVSLSRPFLLPLHCAHLSTCCRMLAAETTAWCGFKAITAYRRYCVVKLAAWASAESGCNREQGWANVTSWSIALCSAAKAMLARNSIKLQIAISQSLPSFMRFTFQAGLHETMPVRKGASEACCCQC